MNISEFWYVRVYKNCTLNVRLNQQYFLKISKKNNPGFLGFFVFKNTSLTLHIKRTFML